MKIINMSELQEGDIFAYEIKVRGREAFLVTKSDSFEVTAISKKDEKRKEIKKRIQGSVYLLRNIKDK